MKKNLFLCTALAVSFSNFACQSTSGFPDRSAEIQNLEQQQSVMVNEQEDILAPKQYLQFSENLRDAKKLNSEHKDSSKQVVKAQDLEATIHSKSKPTKAVLAETLNMRRKAIEAGAGESETFLKTDKDLKAATQDAANGDLKAVEKEATDLQNRYANAEGDALVSKAIGVELNHFATLKNKKVQAIAPQTLARTESEVTNSERSIRADRYNAETVSAAKSLVAKEIARLEIIATDAARLNSEPAAIELFHKNEVAALAQQKLKAQSEALATQHAQNAQLQNQLSTVKVEQTEAVKKLALEQKFTDAKNLFNPNEAEVYKDGDNLLIRLKGLSFSQGQGVLPAESEALLKKLGTVVATFDGAHVRVEGHTDSTGSTATNARISQERAGIVKDYLVSRKIVESDKVVVQGLGEEGPVATNKTAAGRAQNRRVDVIVQPAY